MVTWTADPGLSSVVPSDVTPVTLMGTVTVPGAAVDDTATARDVLALAPGASAADPEAGATVIPEPAGGAAAHRTVSGPAAMLLLASVTEPLPPGAASSDPGVTVEEIGDSIVTWRYEPGLSSVLPSGATPVTLIGTVTGPGTALDAAA